MTKYHINSKGVPAICKAEKGNCPFGGANDHYDSPEQAQAAADKIMAETYEILPYSDSEPKISVQQAKALNQNIKAFAKDMYIYTDYYDDVQPEGAEISANQAGADYFDYVMDRHQGRARKFTMPSWSSEVEENKDSYERDPNYYDRELGGGQYPEWTSDSQEDYDRDLAAAEEAEASFDMYRENIEEMSKAVKKIDWARHGVEQEDGEVAALEYMREEIFQGKYN